MTEKEHPLLLKFPIKAENLVPHRPPMLLVEVLLKRSGDHAQGQAIIPESGICFGSDRLLPEFFIELIAQTSAMANGYDCLITGSNTRDGMLVGVDSFKIHFLGTPGAKLTIDIDKKFEFGSITLIQGKVFEGDMLLAEGDIKVWENIDGDEKRAG